MSPTSTHHSRTYARLRTQLEENEAALAGFIVAASLLIWGAAMVDVFILTG